MKSTGHKWWRYRFSGRADGKPGKAEKVLALGVYPEVSLKRAREKRDEARRLLADGIDPSAVRKAAEETQRVAHLGTFEAVAREWLKRQSWGESHCAKNIRRLEKLRYAREEGFTRFGALATRIDDDVKIVFNCAHPPDRVCVNVLEEIWHVRLGHRPSIVSLEPINGRHRTYDAEIEHEAYGCGIATLVPLAALYAMLTQQAHIRRVAEHFFVPVEVVEERIAATNLGDLMNSQLRQFALLPAAV